MDKLKIACIIPPADRILCINLSIIRTYVYHIVAMLEKNNYSVKLSDFFENCDNYRTFLKKRNNFNYDIFCIAAFPANISHSLNLIKKIRNNNPYCKIFLTGHFASLFHKEILSSNYAVDAVIKADPAFTIPKIIRHLLKNKPLTNLKNIAYKINTRIKSNPLQLHKDLNALPHVSGYFYKNHRIKELPVITIYGCPFKCNFCDRKNLWGNTVRYRSIDNVIGEIEKLYFQLNIRRFKFEDENFTLFRKRTLAFCKEIIRRKLKISWSCTTRIDCVDKTLLKFMYFAGCKTIYFGIESGSNKILKILKKNISTGAAIKSILLTKLSGIQVGICIMTGCPGETNKTLEESANFIKKIYPFKSLAVNSFLILPGTELHCNRLKTNGFKDYHWLNNNIIFPALGNKYFRAFNHKIKPLLNNKIYTKNKYSCQYEL